MGNNPHNEAVVILYECVFNKELIKINKYNTIKIRMNKRDD